MEREYRTIVKNIELTKTEAATLFNAKRICEDALTLIYEQPYDNDLKEALEAGLNGLEKCNARLNVNTILDEE